MRSRKKGTRDVIKFILFISILLVILTFSIKYSPSIINLFRHPNDVRDYILSIGIFGYILFALMLVAHVIIVVIPGDILYVLGGYMFGLPLGFLLSYIGILTGGFIVFSFSRLLGYDFVCRLVHKEKLRKMSDFLNSLKGMLGLFIVCLIPIFPKSTLMYAAGLTPIKASKLFFVYALSRIPVIFMWVVVGANAYEKDYFQMGVTIAILFIFAIISLLLKDKIFKKSK